MKKGLILLMVMAIVACNQKQDVTETSPAPAAKMDLDMEYAKIEETRKAFQLAIKEKRYGDLRNWSTKDMKGVSQEVKIGWNTKSKEKRGWGNLVMIASS